MGGVATAAADVVLAGSELIRDSEHVAGSMRGVVSRHTAVGLRSGWGVG